MQNQQIQVIQKDGKNICIMIPFGRNRNVENIEWAQKVYNNFNIPANFVEFPFPGISHGYALDYFINSTLNFIDYYLFFECDSIPLKKDFLDITYDKIKDGNTCYSISYTANHKDKSHIYGGPAFLAFSKELYLKLGKPSLNDNFVDCDTAQNFSRQIEKQGYNLCLIYPRSYTPLSAEQMKESGNPEFWNLGGENRLKYGLGTIYGDSIFHAMMQSMSVSSQLFIQKCQEILNPEKPWLRKTLDDANQSYQNRPDWAKNPKNIKLPDWVEEIKEFFPDKYDAFVSDAIESTRHVKQYKILKELGGRHENRTIIICGVDRGLCSLILSLSRKNKVIGFDIFDNKPWEKQKVMAKYPNFEFRLENILDNPEKNAELLKDCALIHLDAEHLGEFEHKFYKWLKDNDYQGEIFLDDIHLNPQMENFWNSIQDKKEDLTSIGHNTGSGYVDLRKPKLDAIVVSVNCADYLELSLLENVKYFDNFYVATVESDKETQDLCSRFGAKCIICENPHDKNGFAFDKGSCIKQVLSQITDRNRWLLFLDSDIILPPNFRTLLNLQEKDTNILYGVSRSFAWIYQDYLDWKSGRKTIDDFDNIPGGWGVGYFMCFYANSDKINHLLLESIYPNGNIETDMFLLELFHPKRLDVGKLDFKVLHLGGFSLFESGRIDNRGRFDCVLNKKFKEMPDTKELLNYTK